jgi:uncharacterized protein
MLTEQTLTVLKSLQASFAARGVTGLSVFGSQLSGRGAPTSDIDIIVDYDPNSRFSLIDLAAVGRVIEEQLGIKADVMTRTGLHPVLRTQIEQSAVRVY